MAFRRLAGLCASLADFSVGSFPASDFLYVSANSHSWENRDSQFRDSWFTIRTLAMTAPRLNARRANDADAGLGHWMARVPKQCDRVRRKQFEADAVHDLRVALRRCRSMADGLITLDSHADWRAMRKAAGRLFQPLGDLRDLQVASAWLRQLAPADDPVRVRMLDLFASREKDAVTEAAKALQHFDRKQWKQWTRQLPARARRIPPEGRALRHVALERWTEAHALHLRATRTRSQAALHRLRIGVKKFRYSMENFLPTLHQEIGAELKRVQDLLGEVHDLDVLRPLLRDAGDLYDAAARTIWRDRITQARGERVKQYRRLTRNGDSLWDRWRSKLPAEGQDLEAAAFAKLRAWASFLDPDAPRARRLSELAIQLFDGFAAAGVNSVFTDGRARRITRAGALLCNVGHAEGARGHHKSSYRLIRAFPPPLGWSAADMLWTALVARYHRGADPQPGHEGFALLGPDEQRSLIWLAAVVRLADALVAGPAPVRRSRVESSGGIHIWADGFTGEAKWLEHIVEKQRLLESISARPVFVRPAHAPAARARAAAG
jgi:exopolyphosphatase/guanosine-5'-triphosphate,3'-diphosphate pyrophosphatase